MKINWILIVLFVRVAVQSGLSFSQNDPVGPNIILIFADDLGYGDLGCYGHPTISTPNIDKLAKEGQRWTDFYVASSVCTPSRSALLTGQLPVRLGTYGGVFFEWSAKGLPQEEVTIAESLKEIGYKTACIGKWHLGHREWYLPTKQGFDYYFGIPYSNDMAFDREAELSKDVVLREGVTESYIRKKGNKKYGWVPLMEGDKVIEYPADQSTLAKRYTEHCLKFMETNREEPFFLYYALTFPHTPLFASEAFLGKSRRGLYGDVVEEIDDAVGRIIEMLRQLDIEKNTLLIFTSDNGPWAFRGLDGGSAGLLRGAKGQTWEGGMRVPAIFWWPGTIVAGQTIHQLGSTLDLFASIFGILGKDLPETAVDSKDLSKIWMGSKMEYREIFPYYRGHEIYAIRKGLWKAHFVIEGSYMMGDPKIEMETPLLYHLGKDPEEKYDLSEEHPEIVNDLIRLKMELEGQISIAPSLYDEILNYQSLPGWFEDRLKQKAALK